MGQMVDHKIKKLDKTGTGQKKLLQSIQALNHKIIQQLENEEIIETFYVDQRESLIEALKLSEKIDGPIGAEIVEVLKNQQQILEKLIEKKIDESHQEIMEYHDKTKNLKKYNLKNVR